MSLFEYVTVYGVLTACDEHGMDHLSYTLKIVYVR